MVAQLRPASSASPAFQTVVATVRGALNQEVPTLPEEDPDWELVRSIARRHHVIPLVYEGLSAADASSSALPSLREYVQRNTKRNLQLARELIRIVEDFEDAGVRAIPFKGPVLAVLAYGDLNRRTFLDLDLLVHPDDVLEAGRVLRANGYEPNDEFEMLLRWGRTFPLLTDVGECSFHHPRHGEIELRWKHGHWANPLEASFDEWWRRRGTATLAGRDLPVLSPEDRILILATHGNKHAWRRMAWIADVSASLRAGDFDWDAVERRARSWGREVALHVAIALGVWLSEDVTEAIPASVLSRIRDGRRATALEKRAVRRLSRDPLGSPSRFEEITYDLATTASSRKLARATKHAATASVRKMM